MLEYMHRLVSHRSCRPPQQCQTSEFPDMLGMPHRKMYWKHCSLILGANYLLLHVLHQQIHNTASQEAHILDRLECMSHSMEFPSEVYDSCNNVQNHKVKGWRIFHQTFLYSSKNLYGPKVGNTAPLHLHILGLRGNVQPQEESKAHQELGMSKALNVDLFHHM